jgi:hypothetical protein
VGDGWLHEVVCIQKSELWVTFVDMKIFIYI